MSSPILPPTAPRSSPDRSRTSWAPASSGSAEIPNSKASACSLVIPAACDRTSRSHGPEAGHCIVITGSASERGRCLAVAQSAGLSPHSVLAGTLDLGGLAALVADARLVVSGDTGIAHLASAYATPSVVLFGPTSPERWGPPATSPATVIWRGVRGDPHSRWVDPALLDIGSAEVLQAAEARLRGA